MIDYELLRDYRDPPSLTSRPQWVGLLNWTLSVLTVPANRLSLQFLEISNAQFENLKSSCPFLVNPLVDLNTFRSVVYHLSNPPRLSDIEKGNISTLLSTAIGDDEDDTKTILLSYYPASSPPPQGTPLLDLFLHWCRAMLTLLTFSFQKTIAAVEFIQSYEHLAHVTSRTGPLLQSLDLGVVDRNNAQELGRELIHFRDVAGTRAKLYFSIKHPLHPNTAIIQQIHRLLLSGLTVNNAAGLEALRAARDNQNLHLLLILEYPLDPLAWSELKPLSDSIDAYFEKLRKHRPDALSLALF